MEEKREQADFEQSAAEAISAILKAGHGLHSLILTLMGDRDLEEKNLEAFVIHDRLRDASNYLFDQHKVVFNDLIAYWKKHEIGDPKNWEPLK